MIVPSALEKYNVLIADSDLHLGKVMQKMLNGMGFSNITSTPSGQEAIDLLKTGQFDFLITEWNLRHMGGLELINAIRRKRQSTDPALPIILTGGRMEQADIITARNYGINEYVLKPFNTQTLFSRLERMIEQPRNFVISQSFVGPDRRNKGLPPKGVEDRRSIRPTPRAKPENPHQDIGDASTPKIWSADFALKRKLGEGTALSSLITPTVLTEAQQSIESEVSDSLQWIKDDLAQIKTLCDTMAKGEDIYTLLPIDMGELALTLSARAGTFGYTNASKVSYLLYLFCQNHLRPEQPMHRTIAQKHIDVLQAAIHDQIRNSVTVKDDVIVRELKNLVEKYAVA